MKRRTFITILILAMANSLLLLVIPDYFFWCAAILLVATPPFLVVIIRSFLQKAPDWKPASLVLGMALLSYIVGVALIIAVNHWT